MPPRIILLFRPVCKYAFLSDSLFTSFFATLHLHQDGTGLASVSCRTCAAYQSEGGEPTGPPPLNSRLLGLSVRR